MFEVDDVKNIIPYIGSVLTKYNYYDRKALWIYKSGEKDVLDVCMALSKKFLEYHKLKGIIVIADSLDEFKGELPEYIEYENCSKEEIEQVLYWYALCHPYNNMLVISLIYPVGRDGEKWLENFPNISLTEACKSGILRLKNEV